MHGHTLDSRIAFSGLNLRKPQKPKRPPSASQEVASLITRTGLTYASHSGLRKTSLSVSDWLALFRANIEVESAYNTAALSSVGAIGLGQLMPDTAQALGVDPHKPSENLDGSARYLLDLLEQFGTPEVALAAYNAGPGAVRKYGGIPPFSETQGHVRKVLAAWDRIKKEGV